jgi:SAM-dependent methyltransferase
MRPRQLDHLPSREPDPESSGTPDDWCRRRDAARRCFVPWVNQVLPLEGSSVLEYGCGNGPVTAAFAPGTARYVGIDIDEDAVGFARRRLADSGLQPTFLVAPPDEILERTAAFRGEIDVFLCYAVLEHMSVDERLALLRLARDVVRPDGVIVVIETPNRLTPWDYHTSQLPFLNQLPDDLALAYVERSERKEIVDALGQARAHSPAAHREAFVRWGRGVSFHELELVFDDFSSHVLASSWEPVLLSERPVYREEVALDRVLAAARPDIPPAFSRYWLDFIMSPAPRGQQSRFLRPWPLRTTGSTGAAYTAHEVVWMESENAMLAIELPELSSRLVVGLEGVGEQSIEVRVREPGAAEDIVVPATRVSDWVSYAEFSLPRPAEHLELRLSRAATIGYVLHG